MLKIKGLQKTIYGNTIGAMPKTVVASACLCGETCRWHGRACSVSSTVRRLEADGIRVIPACPEMLGGLPCPRPPVKMRQGRVYETDAETRSTLGTERTAEFTVGAQVALDVARMYRAREAYLFRLSPSCALGGITGKLFRASGITVHPTW